jgi:hypothetical protein
LIPLRSSPFSATRCGNIGLRAKVCRQCAYENWMDARHKDDRHRLEATCECRVVTHRSQVPYPLHHRVTHSLIIPYNLHIESRIDAKSVPCRARAPLHLHTNARTHHLQGNCFVFSIQWLMFATRCWQHAVGNTLLATRCWQHAVGNMLVTAAHCTVRFRVWV